MRKAARVFIIIGMILQFYLIFPLIVGSCALQRLDNAKKKDELTGIGIASIILVSTLGGIFMLCVSQSELDEANNQYHQEPIKEDKPLLITKSDTSKESLDNNECVKQETPTDQNDINNQDYISNIKELKALLDNGALTQEEYDILKAEQLGL